MKKQFLFIALLCCISAQATVLRIETQDSTIVTSPKELKTIEFWKYNVTFVKRHLADRMDSYYIMSCDPSQFSKIVFEDTSSDNQLKHVKAKLRIYPNPAHDMVVIEGLTEPATIKLLNMSGNILKSVIGTQLSVSDVPQGTYLLLVNNNVSKLIVE